MNCEEFELIGLDAGSGNFRAEAAAAAEHAGRMPQVCGPCRIVGHGPQ